MINLDGIEINEETRKKLSDIFEKLMTKYDIMSKRGSDRRACEGQYNSGVVDGINHCYKVINGITDDYLDGIDESVTIKKFSDL